MNRASYGGSSCGAPAVGLGWDGNGMVSVRVAVYGARPTCSPSPCSLINPDFRFFFLRARPQNLEIAERFSRQQVVQMHIHSSYLHRMTALYAIQVLTESLDVDMLGKVRVGSWRGGPSIHGYA